MRLTRPVLGEDELEAVRQVLESGFLTQGPVTADFESAVTRLTGSSHAFATSSCTTALHLALTALDVGPGDEVVVPDYTFPATANVVVQLGADPVIADIDDVTFGMRADSLLACLSDRTRAIIPVHAFGLSADMDPLLKVADANGVAVLEDAACALGATYKGRYCGTLGRAGAFSFHPRKSITTGEGGMVVTDDDALADRLKVLRSHGSVRDGMFLKFVAAGYNYRLSDVNAAIGVVQMSRLESILQARRERADCLTALLMQIPGVRPPIEPEGSVHTYQSYVVLLDDGIDRDAVVRRMLEEGIETTLGTYSLQDQPFFARMPSAVRISAPVAKRVHSAALTLPLHPALDQQDLERVAEALARATRGT